MALVDGMEARDVGGEQKILVLSEHFTDLSLSLSLPIEAAAVIFH